jgi:hypothetical protein
MRVRATVTPRAGCLCEGLRAHAGVRGMTRTAITPSMKRPPAICEAVASHHRVSRAARLVMPACFAFMAAACTTPPTAQIPPANDTLPDALRATPNEVLQDVLTAVGDTTYTCRRKGDALSWVETGSDATLVDPARRSVGTVAPGRYFVGYDGSYVVGRVAGEEVVAANALPWQRLVARFNAGERRGEGRFARTSSVQRVQTTGGMPPDPACAQEGVSLFVPYSATYLFYRNAEPSTGNAVTTPVPGPAVNVSHAVASSGVPASASDAVRE